MLSSSFLLLALDDDVAASFIAEELALESSNCSGPVVLEKTMNLCHYIRQHLFLVRIKFLSLKRSLPFLRSGRKPLLSKTWCLRVLIPLMALDQE